ncbi:MAG TPA: NfeD family protein [Acidimicrobiia bacterium]|nr:NfeD family protein [Acidimicrobiia bacterium]
MPHSTRRGVRRAVALLAIVVAISVLALDALAGAATPPVGKRGIDVVQVEGYLDPPNVSLILDAIKESNAHRSTLLVLQVKSNGAIDTNIDDVVRAIQKSRVPVAVWVGPSGADAKGAATILLQAAHLAYISPGSGAGPGHPVRLDEPSASTSAGVADRLAVLARRNDRDPDGARKLATERLGSSEAYAVRATNGVRPTIGELIVQLNGKKVTTPAGELTLSTAKVIGAGRDRRRQPNQDVVFNRLGLGDSLLHRLISPSIAYFLIVVGLALIVFEFYTASIGLAGLVGALCLIGAFVGFSHLPVHWWALALLFVSLFGFAIDAQADGLGIWTIIATLCLVTGSWFLYGGDAQLRPSWWVFLVVIGGTLLFMLGGMTAMIRSRFSTPTVGREGMIGEEGVAEVAVAPDGVVLIRGARWRARTNRATPIQAGEPVLVAAVEGLVLEVEPPEGGAQDYRERARNRRSKSEE